MGKFNSKLISFIILSHLWSIGVEGFEKQRQCEELKKQTETFECDRMRIHDVNKNLTSLTVEGKITRKPIKLSLVQVTFLTNALRKNFLDANISVEQLVLIEIGISYIEKDAFNSNQFAALEKLELSQMPIKNLPKGIFNGLTNLKQLTLRQVSVHLIERNIFEPVPNLEAVLLSFCGEQMVVVDNLFGSISMHKLTKVTVEHCKLRDTITEATFSGLRNVEQLRLSKNEIQQIGPRSFHVPLQTLQFLKLDCNDLKSISIDLFRTTHMSQAIILIKYNPWHCDCNMDKFQRFMERNGYKMQQITCETPPELAGEPLSLDAKLCNETELESVDELKNGSQNCDHKILNISKPSREKIPTIRLIKQTLLLRYKSFNFDLIQLNGKNEIQNCITTFGNNTKEKTVGYNIDSSQLHRFCSLEKGSSSIKPLDCVNVLVRPINDDVDKPADTWWIQTKDRTTLIVAFGLSLLFGFIIGLYISVGLIKLFPKLIQFDQNNQNRF